MSDQPIQSPPEFSTSGNFSTPKGAAAGISVDPINTPSVECSQTPVSSTELNNDPSYSKKREESLIAGLEKLLNEFDLRVFHRARASNGSDWSVKYDIAVAARDAIKAYVSSAVKAAVEKERERFRWLDENHAFISYGVGARYQYVYIDRFYDSIDALVSAEIDREKERKS